MPYSPKPLIYELGSDFYDEVEAAKFPKHIPRYLNKDKALDLGLKDQLDSEQKWIEHFGKFKSLPDNITPPLALRYHGHQFQSYNPQIGDGRGFLFAQLKDAKGKLLDFGTKGSGQTPYSRFGDGRLTLKGGVREVLATEMLESLGVNTSKSFALIETGEALQRNDEPSPTRSAVLTRLSHSHIRIGTFERLAYFKDAENIKKLVSYCNKELLAIPDTEDPLQFFKEVQLRQAELCAQWMMAGFVHGVLNTDNINITGESFDYGPFRFLPHYEPGFVAAYFDQTGLYAYGRQPNAIHWNLGQLANALSLVADTEKLQALIDEFPRLFVTALHRQFLKRLGLKEESAEKTDKLLAASFQLLDESKLHFEQFFFDFFRQNQPGKLQSAYSVPSFNNFINTLSEFTPQGERPEFRSATPPDLRIDAIESLWKDIADKEDWSQFYDKIESIKEYGRLLGFRK